MRHALMRVTVNLLKTMRAISIVILVMSHALLTLLIVSIGMKHLPIASGKGNDFLMKRNGKKLHELEPLVVILGARGGLYACYLG